MQRPTDKECAVHPMATDGDCEFCHEEFESLQDYAAQLADQCNLLSNEIEKMGKGIDPVMALSVRLNTLIDAIIQDPRQKARFEVMFLESSQKVLADVKTEVQKKKLIQPMPPGGLGNLKRIK